MDCLVGVLPALVLWALVAGNAPSEAVGVLFTAFLWVWIEASLLASFGTTPGKALFAIQLARRDDRPIPFGQALSRSFAVWFFGIACAVPFVAIFTMLFADTRLRREGSTSWDEKHDLIVRHGALGRSRIALLWLIVAGLLLLALAAVR